MTDLTFRQELIFVRLYATHGWSVPYIAEVLGLGRRLVENALRRQNVTLRRGKTSLVSGAMTPAAACAWFADAGRPDRLLEDPEPQTRAVTDPGGDVTLVFRDRRCQACGYLNHYVDTCAICGATLSYRRPDPTAVDVESIILEATHRE